MLTTTPTIRRALGIRLVWHSIALFSILTLPMARVANAAEPNETELFESKIRPLLAERCQSCHGVEKQRGGLRLDSRAGLLAGGENGPVVAAGQPADSELIRRVIEADDDVRMPPAKMGSRLSDEQIALLKRWIEIGAPWPESAAQASDAREKIWREHWAFQAIKHVDPPAVRERGRVNNAIDQFILQKLEAADIGLSPEVDPRTLIRRATYDLTGLPPTAEEVSAFIADHSPEAYERLIDRLLASPRYGEQWGRHWLDVARYADTKGYVYGREERFFLHSAHYRDWVVRAFNDDMPYDRFVLLQLAADQVAPEDPRELAAMGFLTVGRRFLGVTPDIIDDRIDVVSRGLLGLTVGCARCHDHKYDPIPTADYYSLYGVFQNCVERQTPLPRLPESPAPTPEYEQGLQSRRNKLNEVTATRRAEAGERIRQRLGDYLLAQRELDKYPEIAFFQYTDKADLIPGIVRRWETFLAQGEKNHDSIFAAWIALARLKDDEFPAKAEDVLKELRLPSAGLNIRVAEAFATPPGSIKEVAARYGQLFSKVDATWQALCESAKRDGLPAPRALPVDSDEVLRLALYGSNSPCVIPDEPIVATDFYWDKDAAVELWGLQTDLDRWLLTNPSAAPHAVVLSDRPSPVDAQIFRRGNPANKGDFVPRHFLSVLTDSRPTPFSVGSGRLEMAQVIASPKNPLTARVWVNRVWLHHFGSGLVNTPSDFGVRAEAPSHPELLDWLAEELIANHWSTKSLHRMIMLSAAYRQRSNGPTEVADRLRYAQKDPENRLLWRMNERRLSFEQMCDTLEVLSDELDFTMGGKAVDPFTASNGGFRRTIYTLIDRQFLPTTFQVFDFANPDLHSPQRTETTAPQQALFALNSPFVAGRSRAIAKSILAAESTNSHERVMRLYQRLLQREPTEIELSAALAFVEADKNQIPASQLAAESAWSYGYGEVEEQAGRMKSFAKLPFLAGSAWQGGPHWPDAHLGWVKITAEGGHAGDDLQHAAVRRWTASAAGVISVRSVASHDVEAGDGVRCQVVSSRHGVLKSAIVHNTHEPMDLKAIEVQPGDTLDFVVERYGTLQFEEFFWSPRVTQTKTLAAADATSLNWDATRDFTNSDSGLLTPWEQLTQLLLISNEVMFVD